MTLYNEYKKQGFDFFVGVPCSCLKLFIKELLNDSNSIYIPAPREDIAMGIAVGAWMNGKKPAIYLQSSGLGHLVNPITSLLKPYGIEIHLLISLRCDPEEHREMMRITRDLLALLEYNNFRIIEEVLE